MLQKWYTYAVRLCLIGWMIIFIQYIRLGLYLLTMQQYQDVFQILKQSMIDITYISRVISSWVSIGVWNISTILYPLLDQIHIIEILCIVCLIFVFPLLHKKSVYQIGSCIAFSCSLSMIVFAFGIRCDSLQEAMVYMKVLGGILTCMGSICCALILYIWKKYERT